MLKLMPSKIVLTMLFMLGVSSLFMPPVLAAPTGYADYEFIPTRYYAQSDSKVLFTINFDNAGYVPNSIVWKNPQDIPTTCNPLGGVCSTTYEYAPNNVVTSQTTEFLITGQERSLGRYTAVVTYCTNYSGGHCASQSTFEANFFITLATQAPVIATVPILGTARGIDTNPTTNQIYVANGNHTVSVIDGLSSTVVATVTVGSNPMGVGVNPATNLIYVTNMDSDTVSVIDGASNTLITTVPVGTSPIGVGVNPTTNRIYVANEYIDTVSVIDGANNTVLATVPVGMGPRGVGVNPTTNRIYVANEYTHNVSVIDGASNTVIAKVPVTVDSFPLNLAANPATNRIYVGSSSGNTLAVIDGASNTVVTTLTVGTQSHWYVGANPTTNHIYVTDNFAVLVLDGASNTIMATIPFGRPAAEIGINPTSNRVYVANRDGNSVSVIQEAAPAGQTKVYLPLVVQTNP